MTPELLILFACLVGMLMTGMHYRHRARVKARRGAMFDQCKHLFYGAEIRQDDVDFPVLTGQYQGYSVKLEPIADHVGYRKLPSLWLLITVKAEQPYEGIFDFLVRPQNIEFYSPNERLEHRVAIPANWPQHAVLKTSDPKTMPPLTRLDPHMAVFDDNKCKELLITPRGIRLVYQANQAEQTNYRTMRSLAFRELAVSPELLADLLDKILSIHQDLSETESTPHESEPNDHHRTTYLQAAC